MMRRSLAFALVCVACNSYQAPPPPAPRDATKVRASAGQTWDAVVDLFAARNIPIRTIERATALVATVELPAGAEGRKWADCGKRKSVLLGPERAIYNVFVRGDSVTSSVKATVRWTRSDAKRRVIECSTTYAWEEGFEASVKAHAERASKEPSRGANARPNNLLLSFAGFSRVMGDMRRKGMILRYREAALERLEVDLTASAFREPTLEYQLTRLFLAYGGTMEEDTQPTLIVRKNGLQVGHFTRSGLQWDAATGRPRCRSASCI
jgi:hypothetical protein